MLTVRFQTFRSSIKSWDTLFQEAADFASQFPPERLISISNAYHGEGVVTVWYWADDRDDPEVV